MTHEEAVEYLKKADITVYQELKTKTAEALEMAIKALEQEPVLDKIKAEIEGWQGDIHDNEYDADKYDFVFERIFEIIDKYKTEVEEGAEE